MKKKALIFVCVAAVVLAFAGTGLAQQNNTGCGLGSIAFAGKDGLVSQVLAVTTNGTLGTQTFGITSGTSNCERPVRLTDNRKLRTFVAENMDNLAKDIAQGNGEYLNTLAVLMEIPEAEKGSFYGTLQTNFSRIYTSDKVSDLEVLQNIEAVVSPT